MCRIITSSSKSYSEIAKDINEINELDKKMNNVLIISAIALIVIFSISESFKTFMATGGGTVTILYLILMMDSKNNNIDTIPESIWDEIF